MCVLCMGLMAVAAFGKEHKVVAILTEDESPKLHVEQTILY